MSIYTRIRDPQLAFAAKGKGGNTMKQFVSRNAPWSSSVAWWVVLIQGIIALGMGIFFVIQPRQSGQLTMIVVGGYLLVTSILGIYAGLRGERRPARMIRGGMGFIVGLLVVLQPFLHSVNVEAARTILAIGLFASGLVGLYGALVREEGRFRWGTVIDSLLSIGIAWLLFYAAANPVSLLIWIGTLAIIFGILLVIYALLLYRRTKAQVTPTVASM